MRAAANGDLVILEGRRSATDPNHAACGSACGGPAVN
jgi:hypothetical protein